MRPDLDDPAARAAYRGELLAVGKRRRMLGFILILLGAAAIAAPRLAGIAPGRTGAVAAWIAIGAGFALFAWVIAARTLHHKARMREE